MEVESITAPDAEESALRELGIQTDQEQGRVDTEATKEAPEARAPESPQPEPQAQEPEQPKPGEQVESKAQLPRDETGKFTKGQKPETEYSKAQKEEIRKDRSWAALQAQKEEFYRQQAAVQEQQRIQQLEAARAQFQPIKVEGLTGQEYYQGYLRFKQAQDYENAARALEVALEIQNAEQARAGQIQQVNAEYAWRMGMNEVAQSNPAVFDPNTPVPEYIEQIIQRYPQMYNLPEGFQLAAEGAMMLANMDRMQEMQDELIELRAFKEKYQRKSQPGKGGYAAPRTGEKDFDDMTLDEQEAHLKSLTQEADNYR